MPADPIEQIDLHLLKIAFPACKTAELLHWVEPLKAACRKYGINTVREVASFLGNIAVESADLQRLTESLNYSVEGLLKTFGRHRISEADCRRLGRTAARPANQEAIANILYGGEFGRKHLGNSMPGDGWKFRGYGCKQLTGRANVTKFAAAMGMTIDQALAYLRTREGSCASAGWFWQTHNLDARALTPGWDDDRRAINGGVLGLETVEQRANALVRELLARGC
jgi:putative chitinase